MISSKVAQSTKTVLYGWGRTQAMPLTKGTMNRVFQKPVCLQKQEDYALSKDEAITHVASGWGHSLIATRNNQVYAFGLNQSGQLGTLSDTNHKVTDIHQEDIKLLACGREHSHIVTQKDNGTKLYSFGNNMYGQLGVGKSKNTAPGELVAERRPQLVSFEEEIEHIVCGLDNTILSTRNAIYGMGWSADGQLGQGKDDKDTPSKLLLQCHVKKLASSTDFTMALGHDGRLWTWGNSEYGQGVQGKVIDRILEPLEVEVKDVIDVAAGGPFSVLLTKDGRVHTCGYGALGLGKDVIQTLELTHVKGLENVVKVFGATDYAAAITDSGELYTWGLNGPSHRLGLGSDAGHAFVPKRVDIDRRVVDLSLGTYHAMALCDE